MIFSSSLCLLLAATHAGDFTTPPLNATTSWFGNTFSGAEHWVQQDVHGLCVLSDGTFFTNVYWDEGGGNVAEYHDGQLVRNALHLHGWGVNGGDCVAANSRYLYIGSNVGAKHGDVPDPSKNSWPANGLKWLGLSRRPRTDITEGASFPGGKGGKGGTLPGAYLLIAEVPEAELDAMPGVCADEHKLYVADAHAKMLKVFDAETMQPVTSWPIELGGPLALDATGALWMLERRSDSAPARLLHLSPEGKPLAPPFALGPSLAPHTFCVAPDGRLFVADDGPGQQIHVYTCKGNALVETGRLGAEGGLAHGTPGEYRADKFNHITGLGADAKGNLIIAQDNQGHGGTILQSQRLDDGAVTWQLFGLGFIDLADVDAENETEVFTKEEHYHLDYSKPPGQEWSYVGCTLAPFRYPQDPRMHTRAAGAWVRQIGGIRVLFVTGMNGEFLQVYRFAPKTDGEVAIPSGFFAKKEPQPPKHAPPATAKWPPNAPEGVWIWRDGNGNGAFEADEFSTNGEADLPDAEGWWVDRAGGIWLTTERLGIRYFPFQRLDNHGNPRWDFATMQTFPLPEGFQAIKRIRYDVATDTLYLGGTTAEDKNQQWKPMGPVVARYDGWMKGTRQLAWRRVLPYAHGSHHHGSCEPAGFDLAGDYLFAPYTGESPEDGVAWGHVEVLRAADGQSVGHFGPGPTVGKIGLQDLRESLTAHRRANGEYVIIIEDDYRAKSVMYRWMPK